MPPKVKPQATGDISEQLTFGPGVITKLLFHSIAISFVPVSLFYLIAFDWLDPLFAATVGVPDKSTKNNIGAIVAVVAVNVVVGAFVLSAFREDNEEDKRKKND